MKIATWNIDRRNKKAPKGIKTLLDVHEVVCLQEVRETMLDEVKALAPHHFISDECEWRGGTTYLVTLSKHPITQTEVVEHQHWRSLRNFWRGQDEGRTFHRVDIDRDGKTWRIINTHLPLNVSPYCRMCEWARIWGETDQTHDNNIIAGDFNTFAGPIWALFFGAFLGFRIKDLFLNERNLMQKYIERSAFVNPHKKLRRTHAHVPYQLDFLLHEESQGTHKAIRWSERLGSDHWPLSLEIS